MTTLTIQDLAHTEALDKKALAAVRGGMGRTMAGGFCWPSFPGYDDSKHDKSLNVTQTIGQSQQVFNANGNNVAFADGISSTVKPVQTASNSVFA